MAYHKDVENDELTDTVIGKAIDIHKALGPGLAEATYRDTLADAVRKAGEECETERPVDLSYGGRVVTSGRLDLWIAETLVIELKVVKALNEDHFAQLGRYVRAMEATRGLLINFGNSRVRVRRYTNFELAG